MKPTKIKSSARGDLGIGPLNDINIHERNQDVADALIALVREKRLAIRRNSSTWGKFDGYHRWVILRPGVSTGISINSRGCLTYEEARFAQNFLPSITGERRALLRLLSNVRSMT